MHCEKKNSEDSFSLLRRHTEFYVADGKYVLSFPNRIFLKTAFF